jgi:5-methylcytosine-specific restriction enzyme B
MDVALRRRFAFLELMPDSDVLGDARAGDFPLAKFLDSLNAKLLKFVGRDKQIGHSFLLGIDGKPLTTKLEFADVFKQEILPLLQEYVGENSNDLKQFLGDLVDEEGAQFDEATLNDPEALTLALRQIYFPEKPSE